MQLTEINLIVGDLRASHTFYIGLGWTMRSITMRDSSDVEAWLTTSGPAPVSLHRPEFAAWWDPTAPTPVPGSTTLDLTFEQVEVANSFLAKAVGLGGAVIVEPRPMPWGQNYAVFSDLDGYRWGLKSPA